MSAPRRSSLAQLALFAQLVIPHAVTAQDSTGVNADSTERIRRTGVQQLTGMKVVSERNRSAGYTVRRSHSAMKSDVLLRDTPASVSVVTAAVIADQSMQSMADVLRFVPGVTSGLGEGHRDQPTIRGNGTTADFFIDGVRDDAQYLRDLYNVDRVEVLKGSNAMTFGRGGGGGVINRMLKSPSWAPTRSMTLEGGSFDHRRATGDVGGASGAIAARLNGLAERSGGFRDAARLERYGANPTLSLAPASGTLVTVGYEFFRDSRRVDRGIPAYQGAPSVTARSTFFGNPDVNNSRADVHGAQATIERELGDGFSFRSHSTFGDYDKFYQNTYPGVVNASGTQVAISAYNHAIARRNLFNQSELALTVSTGAVKHSLLAGVELGRQRTAQYRNTGFFNGTSATLDVPFVAPTVSTPVAFRQTASDADNNAVAYATSAYVQDQIALTSFVQAVVGVRSERFDIRFHDNRARADLQRVDRLLSPRIGLVIKPVQSVSLYSSVSRSYLPSSGDQFTSLTVTTQVLEPERFINREAGVKWQAMSGLELSSAVYRLDRTNTTSPDPVDVTRTLQTGSQRTSGIEAGAMGRVSDAWQIIAGYANQTGTITSTTRAAKTGATLPLVPRHTWSLWNRFGLTHGLGAGLGVVGQSEMFGAIDNVVRLPGFTRVDGALYLPVSHAFSAQLNMENVLGRRYFASSHGNNNIMPGAPRTVRVSLTATR